MIRFRQGEVIEREFNRAMRRAEVVELYEDGWVAKMRFLDDGDTFKIHAAQMNGWRRLQQARAC